jgi:hypothetical protein
LGAVKTADEDHVSVQVHSLYHHVLQIIWLVNTFLEDSWRRTRQSWQTSKNARSCVLSNMSCSATRTSCRSSRGNRSWTERGSYAVGFEDILDNSLPREGTWRDVVR